MPYVRWTKLFQAHVLDGFEQSNKPSLQTWRQVLDFCVDAGIKGFNRPSHLRYIAYMR